MATMAGAAAGAPWQGRAAVSPVGLLCHAAWELAWTELGLVWGSGHKAVAGSSRAETGNQPGFLHVYHSEGFSCVGALLSNKKTELPVQSLSPR